MSVRVSQVLSDFEGKFKLVVFAILEDANCGKAHNPEGNCLPFARTFDVPILTMEPFAEAVTAGALADKARAEGAGT